MLAIILFFLFLLSHREPWVLEYHCEGSSEDFCSDGGHGAEKSFPTKQEAIDWIQGNYIYRPEALRHGDVRMACVITYLDDNTPEAIAACLKNLINDRSYEHTAEQAAVQAYSPEAISEGLNRLVGKAIGQRHPRITQINTNRAPAAKNPKRKHA